jgi:hypothetical protein
VFIVLQEFVVVWCGVVCGWVVVVVAVLMMMMMTMMITITLNLNATTRHTYHCNKIYAAGFTRDLSSLQRRWCADYLHVAPNGDTNADSPRFRAGNCLCGGEVRGPKVSSVFMHVYLPALFAMVHGGYLVKPQAGRQHAHQQGHERRAARARY